MKEKQDESIQQSKQHKSPAGPRTSERDANSGTRAPVCRGRPQILGRACAKLRLDLRSERAGMELVFPETARPVKRPILRDPEQYHPVIIRSFRQSRSYPVSEESMLNFSLTGNLLIRL